MVSKIDKIKEVVLEDIRRREQHIAEDDTINIVYKGYKRPAYMYNKNIRRLAARLLLPRIVAHMAAHN